MIQGGGIAAVSIAFSEHALRLAGSPRANPTPLAIAAIAVTALVNVVGVKPGSRLLNGLVLVKILSLAALILGGLWLAPRLAALPMLAAVERAARHRPGFRRRARAHPVLLRRLAEREHRGGRDDAIRCAPCRAPSSSELSSSSSSMSR